MFFPIPCTKDPGGGRGRNRVYIAMIEGVYLIRGRWRCRRHANVCGGARQRHPFNESPCTHASNGSVSSSWTQPSVPCCVADHAASGAPPTARFAGLGLRSPLPSLPTASPHRLTGHAAVPGALGLQVPILIGLPVDIQRKSSESGVLGLTFHQLGSFSRTCRSSFV